MLLVFFCQILQSSYVCNTDLINWDLQQWLVDDIEVQLCLLQVPSSFCLEFEEMLLHVLKCPEFYFCSLIFGEPHFTRNDQAPQSRVVCPGGGGGGVLPNMGYIGMCGPKRYGFSAVLLIDRVSILAILPPFL